jgi:hypothetical protein
MLTLNSLRLNSVNYLKQLKLFDWRPMVSSDSRKNQPKPILRRNKTSIALIVDVQTIDQSRLVHSLLHNCCCRFHCVHSGAWCAHSMSLRQQWCLESGWLQFKLNRHSMIYYRILNDLNESNDTHKQLFFQRNPDGLDDIVWGMPCQNVPHHPHRSGSTFKTRNFTQASPTSNQTQY